MLKELSSNLVIISYKKGVDLYGILTMLSPTTFMPRLCDDPRSFTNALADNISSIFIRWMKL